MYFTREQIDEIIYRIKSEAKKDTDLPETSTLSTKDRIPIVQDYTSKTTSVKEFADLVVELGANNFKGAYDTEAALLERYPNPEERDYAWVKINGYYMVYLTELEGSNYIWFNSGIEADSQAFRIGRLENETFPPECTLSASASILRYTSGGRQVTLTYSTKRFHEVFNTGIATLDNETLPSLNGTKTYTQQRGSHTYSFKVNVEGFSTVTKTATVYVYYPFATYTGTADSWDESTKSNEGDYTSLSGRTFTVNNIPASPNNFVWLQCDDNLNISGLTSGGFAVPIEQPIIENGRKYYRITGGIQDSSITFKIN